MSRVLFSLLVMVSLVWGEIKITASDAGENHLFGNAVVLNGDLILVGTFGDSSGRGAAYIFEWDGSNWNETHKLTASDDEPYKYFGAAVAINGNEIFIGASHDNTATGDGGAVYVFELRGGQWVETHKLTAHNTSVSANFGESIVTIGDQVIVGAPGSFSSTGSAHVFEKEDTTWIETQRLLATDNDEGNHFSTSMAGEGTTLVIGAIGVNINGTLAGAVYVFELDSIWIQTHELIASDGQAGILAEMLRSPFYFCIYSFYIEIIKGYF